MSRSPHFQGRKDRRISRTPSLATQFFPWLPITMRTLNPWNNLSFRGCFYFYTQIACGSPGVLISCTSKHPNKIEQGQWLTLTDSTDRVKRPVTWVKDSVVTRVFTERNNVSRHLETKNRHSNGSKLMIFTTWWEVSTLIGYQFVLIQLESEV